MFYLGSALKIAAALGTIVIVTTGADKIFLLIPITMACVGFFGLQLPALFRERQKMKTLDEEWLRRFP